AGIDLKEGTVAADRIHLQRGAIIDVGKLVRQDGQDGLPEVTGTQALDTERMFNLRMSTCGSSDVSQHDRLIVAEGKKRDIIHNPSIYAGNVQAGDLQEINSVREGEEIVISDSSWSLAYIYTNPERLRREKKEVCKAGGRIVEAAKKGVHFIFDSGSKQQSPIIPKTITLSFQDFVAQRERVKSAELSTQVLCDSGKQNNDGIEPVIDDK